MKYFLVTRLNVLLFVGKIWGNLVLFSPFFPNLLDAWSKRNHPNLHFVFFEDMKKVAFAVEVTIGIFVLNFFLSH